MASAHLLQSQSTSQSPKNPGKGPISSTLYLKCSLAILEWTSSQQLMFIFRKKECWKVIFSQVFPSSISVSNSYLPFDQQTTQNIRPWPEQWWRILLYQSWTWKRQQGLPQWQWPGRRWWWWWWWQQWYWHNGSRGYSFRHNNLCVYSFPFAYTLNNTGASVADFHWCSVTETETTMLQRPTDYLYELLGLFDRGACLQCTLFPYRLSARI